MNLLTILANPRKNSYTLRLLQAFLASYRLHHPADTVCQLDLYRTELPTIDADVIQAWSKSPAELSPQEQSLLARVHAFTDQFASADKIVFAAPMWNLQFPPLLPAYLANIMVVGKTFRYTETGCQGLLKDRPLLLLHVRGGVFSSGPLQPFDHAVPYLRDLCAMMGLSGLQTVVCEGAEMLPDRAEEIVAAAELQAKQLAVQF